jgi:hypothetical protein
MPDILDGEVTRPESFDEAKDYALVIARGDEWLADYDVVDSQKILRQDLKVFSRPLFVEGAVILESGGVIAAPAVGVHLGDDEFGSAGEYIGIESQVYTVWILTGGPAGTATYSWRSTGADNPETLNKAFPVNAIAPDLATALADLPTYGHKIGVLGVLGVFVNSAGSVTGANSWVIDVTYGARTPTVQGNDITVYDVLVPVNGRIHRAAKQTLTYPAAVTGNSIVYAEWIREVRTHLDDPDLTDPASDRAQAWRERWRITLKTTDTSALPLASQQRERRVFPLYNWNRATDVVTRTVPNPYAIDINKTQGSLDAKRLLNVDQNELLLGIFSDFDNGAHGSYVVEPLAPFLRAAVSTNAPSPGKIRLSVYPVRAKVEGVKVERFLPTELEIDQAVEFGHVADEPHVFATGTNKYKLNKALGTPTFPIKEITKVTATIQVGTVAVANYEGVTRNPVGLFDNLAHSPLVSIIRISNTNGGAANYTAGVDYQLTGNQIEWIVTGARPANGATYYVVYQWSKTMTPVTDYTLSAAGEIDFTPAGDDPVNGSTFQVDYDYYLPRTDAIILRPTGEFAVIKGLPSEAPTLPTIPLLTLPYVRADVGANSSAVVLTAFRNDAVDMVTLNRMIAALIELTEDFALQDLLNQARSQTTANLLDVFAEDFSTLEIADENYNVGGNVFDCTVDVAPGELTLPFDQSLFSLAHVAPPAGQTDVRTGDNFYTLPYTDELAVDQPYWSVHYPVNPYADFNAEPASARLDPEQDFFVDTTVIGSSRTRWYETGAHESSAIVGASLSTKIKVTEVAAARMRQIPVQVFGIDFVPGEKIRLKFDGKDVQLTAIAPTTQGPDAFTVIARASELVGPDVSVRHGDFHATFTVPANVPVGSVPAVIYGDLAVPGSVWPGSYQQRAALTYTGNGVFRTTNIITILRIVQNDPIAQSIVFPGARMISKSDIPLGQKPANGGPPLYAEWRVPDRSGQASTPTNLVLSQVRREPIDINVGDASSNVFACGDPVYMPPNEFRSLVLRSASNEYEAYVATVGAANRTTGGFVTEQAIPGGIFMDSSNNTDWTLRQGSDLRCKIYVAKMTANTAYLYFDRATFANTTALYLSPDQVVPDGTSIEWQYSVDGLALDNGGKVWTTFVPYVNHELGAVAAQVDVRAILRTDDLYVTPLINRFNTSLLLLRNKLSGKYISRQKLLTANQNAVHGKIEVMTPAGGTQVVKVSLDDGATFTTAPLGAPLPSTDGFTSYPFDVAGLAAGSKLRVMVDQTTGNRALRPRMRSIYAFAAPV